MQAISLVSVCLFLATVEVQGQAQTECARQGGECRPKRANCCPAKMSFNPDLCNGNANRVCCLPGSAAGAGAGHGSPDECEYCSQKQQEVLCEAENNYNLLGNDKYDPYIQVPQGCNNGSCLARGPDCYNPEYVCLRKKILNLIECAPNACNPASQWDLVSLLNSDSGPQNRDFCDGKSILFNRRNGQACGFGDLKNMCEDVGGIYERDGSYVYCKLA